MPATETRREYHVYIRARDGSWKLQCKPFEFRVNAIACADNVSKWTTAIVNEVTLDRSGRILTEMQIHEARLQGAVLPIRTHRPTSTGELREDER